MDVTTHRSPATCCKLAPWRSFFTLSVMAFSASVAPPRLPNATSALRSSPFVSTMWHFLQVACDIQKHSPDAHVTRASPPHTAQLPVLVSLSGPIAKLPRILDKVGTIPNQTPSYKFQ